VRAPSAAQSSAASTNDQLAEVIERRFSAERPRPRPLISAASAAWPARAVTMSARLGDGDLGELAVDRLKRWRPVRLR
jgi:hypothetical protein